MLDRTAETSSPIAPAQPHEDATAPVERAEAHGVARRFWDFFVAQSFSSLTRRIVFLNVAGLLAMVIGILYLS